MACSHRAFRAVDVLADIVSHDPPPASEVTGAAGAGKASSFEEVQRQMAGPRSVATHAARKPTEDLASGKTAAGETCACTDPVRQKPSLFGKNRDQASAEELRAKREHEAQMNAANRAVAPAFGRFQKELGEYDRAMDKLESLFNDFEQRRAGYERAFWDMKDAYVEKCRPLVELEDGTTEDCDDIYRDALHSFLTRRQVPRCLVGEVGVGGLPVTPVAASAIAPPSVMASVSLFARSRGCQPQFRWFRVGSSWVARRRRQCSGHPLRPRHCEDLCPFL